MSKIKDIADAAGVSSVIFSRGLSGKKVRTAVGMRVAINALNYTPSFVGRSLKTGRHNAIGVVIHDMTNPFPVVIVDWSVTSTNCKSVLGDNVGGIASVVDHLVELVLHHSTSAPQKAPTKVTPS